MKAIVYSALGEFSCKEIELPSPAADEVCVRMKASGLCHTDIDVLYGRYGNSTFPLVPGHEYAGIVHSVGENIDGFSVGDRVIVDPNIHCGSCSQCHKGLFNLCESLGAYGVTENGGFAEYSVVRQENLVAAGDLPFELAALAEPIGCALTGINAAITECTKNALIIGAGPLGMLIALSLRAKGVDDIMVIDKQQPRLELAASLGFKTVHSESPSLKKLKQAFDFTADVTGVPAVAESLISYTASGGSALIFGVCPPEATISISPFEIFRRQISIVGTHSLNHNIAEAVGVIHQIGTDLSKLISHKIRLEEMPLFLQKRPDVDTLKVQVIN